ncbi:hypothetical protein AAHA92_33804 [Salvia divinorum]|uniref:Secreted protein n=1 Tax=Salvia divinorum TaxID=28513 RepID=A0ABD1FGZ1_SALDI
MIQIWVSMGIALVDSTVALDSVISHFSFTGSRRRRRRRRATMEAAGAVAEKMNGHVWGAFHSLSSFQRGFSSFAVLCYVSF